MLTHAYVHWLADPDESGQAVPSAVFAPAFTLSFHDSELKISEANAPANGTFRATDTANAHSLGH